jgi:hypothetical protein
LVEKKGGTMKDLIRIRELENGMWVAEAKKWYWFKWRAISIGEYDTMVSLRNGRRAEYVRFYKQGSDHYPTMWKPTFDDAFEVVKKYVSFLGK